MSMNAQKHKDLDRRAGVPALTLALLSRARGLDLLTYDEGPIWEKVQLARKQYFPQVVDLNYPVPGYPPARASSLHSTDSETSQSGVRGWVSKLGRFFK